MFSRGLSNKNKLTHLGQLAEYREELKKNPKLKSLFIELTDQCNEHCLHCGSRCDSSEADNLISCEEIRTLLNEVKSEFDINDLRLCITGGEPLLRRDFFEIMEYAHSLGYTWGMTSNGTLISDKVARQLKDCGLKTISISLDGLRESHDWFRQTKGGYDRAVEGIYNLHNAGISHVQITSVIHKRNISELEDMYRTFSNYPIDSWRVINIEPIGRALEYNELLLERDDIRYMLDFISEKRRATGLLVTYGCSHYLPIEYEREVRKWYFLCNAGVYTASVTHEGNITACLDIERRAETVEGNIRTDSFTDVWKMGFKIYRSDYRRVNRCAECSSYNYCNGDSFHTWDFDNNEPRLCMIDILKE